MELSAHLVQHLNGLGYKVTEHWPDTYDAQDDYPSFCIRAALAVLADQHAGTNTLGIVLGGSGNGEHITANKVKGVGPSWRGTMRPPLWPVSTTTRTLSLLGPGNIRWK